MDRAWLGRVPPIRWERHYGDRIVRCFVERPRNAYDLLREAAVRNPDGEAIVCGAEHLTYRALEAAVARCAADLEAEGIGKGDRVAMLLGNGLPFPILMFAALRLGAIAVPLSVREQAPGIGYMLAHSGAKLLAYDAALADRLPAPEATPQLARRVAVAPGPLSAALPLLAAPTCAPPAAVEEEDTAIILYTSGTTGRPKGALLTHLSICHSALHYEYCMGLTSGDRAVAAVPMSHVTGVIALIAAMVRAAAALIVMPAFKAAEFLELAAQERMTHSLMVPAMYNLCLLDPAFDAARLSAWRVGGYGGAPMAPATIARLAEKLPGLNLMNAYGSTETTSPVTLMPPSETAARSDSVGCAVPCADILVMDDDGRELRDGEAGELWLGGPMVVPGYWNDPAATAENFVAGHWRSGDIGSKDAEGYVRVFDRKKDMINRGGYKIYSVEVENALMSCPGVVEAAVVAEPCPVLERIPLDLDQAR
jgi:O-succinylbenzoic acid--CoA ligase